MRVTAFSFLVLGVLMVRASGKIQIRNPGFEERDGKALRGWQLSGKAVAVNDPGVAHGGEWCVKARFDDGAAQSLSVQGGAAYRLTGWIRRVDPSGREIPKIKVYFLDAKGGRADVQAAVFDEVPADDWHRWDTVVQAPPHAATMNITLRGFFGGSEWFYYDDLAIAQVEARSWPAGGQTPDLNGKTVVVAEIADVWTDALLRIPPASIAPVDGRLATSVFTRGEDIRVVLARPCQVDWALIHSMRPGASLRNARLSAVSSARNEDGRLLALTTIGSEVELVSSSRFAATLASEFVLEVPENTGTHVHEVQLFSIIDGVELPGRQVLMWLVQGEPPAMVRDALVESFSSEEHRSCVVGTSSRGGGTVLLPAERHISLFATPEKGEYGFGGVTLEFGFSEVQPGTMLELTVRLPEELDVDIRWTTVHDRGLTPRGRRRNYATSARIVGGVEGDSLTVSVDTPDVLYRAGEPVWLTLRSSRDVKLDLGRSRVGLRVLEASSALPGYVPQLERLVRRMYSDASEAHAYDSRDWSRMVIGGYVRRVLELDPENAAATSIYRRLARVRENVELVRPGVMGAPAWAVWAREALRRRDEIIAWWLEHRQQANGELAGHINDDGEFSCNWPSHYLMTGDERIADALRKLADVAWEMSAGTGYTVGSRDVEHAAEDQSCTQPQMLLVDYGNPTAVERLMAMSRYFDLWTAINEAGRRQFRSYMFTTKQVWDDPPYDVDHPYCPLAMVGTGHLIWYARSPQVSDVFFQEAESWALGCLSTDGGKRAGEIPKEIRFRDSQVNPYAPYPTNPVLAKRNSLYRGGAGAYIVRYFLQGAGTLTDDDVYKRLLALWESTDEEKVAAARRRLQRFTTTVVPSEGPERRYAVTAAKFADLVPPLSRVRDGVAVGTTTAEDGGTAVCSIDVPVAGRYAVWGLLGRSDTAESGVLPKTFFVTVDDHPRDRLRIHAPAQEWTAAVTVNTYELAAGRQALRIEERTPGSAIRAIGFTSHYSLEGMWAPRQKETALYDAWRVTGDRTWLVEEFKEVVRQQIRSRWLLTEAEPYTDRVPLPGRDLLSRVFLGDWTSGKSHVPGHWVSWEGGGTDYAALVLDARRDHFKALVHSFHSRERPMTMRLWRLPHGRYDVSVGVDDDGDDAPDLVLQREQRELWRYDGAVAFVARPGRTLVIELRLLAELDDVRSRPDLAIGRDDVQVAENGVSVLVHSIGGAGVPASLVRIFGETGQTLGEALIPALAAPHDLNPKTALVRIPLTGKVKAASVVVDAAGDVAEVTEANNAVRLFADWGATQGGR